MPQPTELTVKQMTQLLGGGSLNYGQVGDNGLPPEISVKDAYKYFANPSMGNLPPSPQTASPASPGALEIPVQTKLGLGRKPAQLPIAGTITQGYGVPQAVKAAGEKIHGGIDIAASLGTPVPEVAGGTVINVENNQGGYGRSVVIQGNDGVVRRYSHLSAANVQKGQQVKAKDIIGTVGTSGASTGPHLDYREYSPNSGGQGGGDDTLKQSLLNKLGKGK